MLKRVVFVLLILFSFTLLYNLGRQIADALNAGNRLDKEADVLAQLQEENKKLRDKLVWVSSYDFVEQTARDKLNLSKPDETVVIVPQQAIDNILGSQKRIEESSVANWQGWFRLISPK